jgi:beta-lactamase regulating signal transducer with metallopeptidase domain
MKLNVNSTTPTLVWDQDDSQMPVPSCLSVSNPDQIRIAGYSNSNITNSSTLASYLDYSPPINTTQSVTSSTSTSITSSSSTNSITNKTTGLLDWFFTNISFPVYYLFIAGGVFIGVIVCVISIKPRQIKSEITSKSKSKQINGSKTQPDKKINKKSKK